MSKTGGHSSPAKAKWYAVQVRPRNEIKISNIFQEKLGMETCVPVQKVWKRKKGEKNIFTRPLLSGYVFILANLRTINWKMFFSPSGVLGIVRSNGAPAPVPSEQVKGLEKLSLSEEPVYEIPYTRPKSNERVEVIKGPLAGAVGYFVNENMKTGKFIVCIDLFKRAIFTELEVDFIRPL